MCIGSTLFLAGRYCGSVKTDSKHRAPSVLGHCWSEKLALLFFSFLLSGIAEALPSQQPPSFILYPTVVRRRNEDRPPLCSDTDARLLFFAIRVTEWTCVATSAVWVPFYGSVSQLPKFCSV
jgi:hypothetical protein